MFNNKYSPIGSFSMCGLFLSLSHWDKDTNQWRSTHIHKYPDHALSRAWLPFSHGLGLIPSARLNTKLIRRKTELTTSTFPRLGCEASALTCSWFSCQSWQQPRKTSRTSSEPLSLSRLYFKTYIYDLTQRKESPKNEVSLSLNK